MSPARGMKYRAREIFDAGDSTFIWSSKTSNCQDQDFDILGPYFPRSSILKTQSPIISTLVPFCRSEVSVEYYMRGYAVFIAHGMEIRTDFFLRWEECTSWIWIEGKGIENAGDVTGTTRVRVDVPSSPKRGILFVDGEVCMIQLTFKLDCLT